jgi:hypothetical protein
MLVGSIDSEGISECGVRILVQVLHVGVSRCAVEVEVALLDVLSMVAFVAVRPKSRSFKIGARPFHRATAKQMYW